MKGGRILFRLAIINFALLYSVSYSERVLEIAGYTRMPGNCPGNTIAPALLLEPEQCAVRCDRDSGCAGFTLSSSQYESSCLIKSDACDPLIENNEFVFYKKREEPIACSAGPPLLPGITISKPPGRFFVACPSLKFTCSGSVYRWEFYSVSDSGYKVHFIVLRGNVQQQGSFQLIGVNDISVSKRGFSNYTVHKATRIDVQPTDFIGFMYDESAQTGVVATLDSSEYISKGYNREDMPTCYKATLWRSEVIMERSSLKISGYPDGSTLPLLRAYVTTDQSGPVLCQQPPYVDHGYYTGQGFREMSTRAYTCDPGYRLAPGDNPVITCLPDGSWTKPPICQREGPLVGAPDVCTDYPVVPNSQRLPANVLVAPHEPGDSLPRSSSSGSVVVYHCNSGYELEGPLFSICQPDGSWSTPPTCIPTPEPRCRAGRRVTVSFRVQFAPSTSPDFIACPAMRVGCVGETNRWIFFSRKDDGTPVVLSVWRESSVGQFVQVANYFWNATVVGRVVLVIPPEARRRVIQDDFVSVHYMSSEMTPVIPWADESYLADLPSPDELYECFTAALYDNEIEQSIRKQGFLNMPTYKARRLPAVQLLVSDVAKCTAPPIVAHAANNFPSTQNSNFGYPGGYSMSYSHGPNHDLHDPLPMDVMNMLVDAGTLVQYFCEDGYRVQGRPFITCQRNGTWTKPPSCQSVVYDCSAGNPPEMLDMLPATPMRKQLYIFPNLRIPCSSEIVRWEFFSMVSERTVIYFDVWRRIELDIYQLIHSNKIVVTQSGRVVYDVPSEDRILIQRDCLLGFHYETLSGPALIPLYTPEDLSLLFPPPDMTLQNISSFDLYATSTPSRKQILLSERLFQYQAKAINHAKLIKEIRISNYMSVIGHSPNQAVAPAFAAYARSVSGCGLAPSVPYAHFTMSDSRGSVGSIATYECFRGFGLIGNSVVKCNINRKWSETPFCQQQVLCTAGYPLPAQAPKGLSTFLMVFTNLTFNCTGVVTAWKYYSQNHGRSVYFGVWRRVDAGLNRYKLVGYNKVTTSTVGLEVAIVNPEDYIVARQGDMIGIHYDSVRTPTHEVVVPFASNLGAAFKKTPPSVRMKMSDGFVAELGHGDIMTRNRIVRFLSPHFRDWRRPALQAIVKVTFTHCGEAPVVAFARVRVEDDSHGAEGTYECYDGYYLVGEATITCQYNGYWTAPPRCVANSKCIWNLLPSTWPQIATSDLEVYTSHPILCSGFIKRWSFVSLAPSGTVYFDVWRPLRRSSFGEAGSFRLQLIGYNTVNNITLGVNTMMVPAESQILVNVGDLIGVHYPDSLSKVIPYLSTKEDVPESELFDVATAAGVYHDEDLFKPFQYSKSFESILHKTKYPAIEAFVYNKQEKPYKACNVWTTCSANSECISLNCRQPTCVCKFGYWLSDDGKKCLPAAQLLQKCDPSTVACATYNARCDPTSNECNCNYDMEPSSDGTRCRPRSTAQNSLLNEPCKKMEDCYQSMLGQDCIRGRCRCSPGYRQKTEEELRIVPTDTRECVELSLNFSFYHAYDERCFAGNSYFDGEMVGENSHLGLEVSTRAPVQAIDYFEQPRIGTPAALINGGHSSNWNLSASQVWLAWGIVGFIALVFVVVIMRKRTSNASRR